MWEGVILDIAKVAGSARLWDDSEWRGLKGPDKCFEGLARERTQVPALGCLFEYNFLEFFCKFGNGIFVERGLGG